MVVERFLNGVRFRWDYGKAMANRRKHGVGFEAACEAFFDPFVQWVDAELADGELRERLIGMTNRARLLVVVYADQGTSFRLISARVASRSERRAYEEQ